VHATQTVFGEGPERASLVVVGEQPGDQEDRSGHPHAEIAVIEPRVVVALGATAARAMLGPEVRVSRDRGILMPGAVDGFDAVVTIHPSAVLRASDDTGAQLFDQLVADLRVAASAARD